MTTSLQDTRCTKCALPIGTKNLTFSEDGICSLCSEHMNNTTCHIKPSDIEEIIVNIKNKGANKPYDCLVGLSGGRDSSYLLWLLVNKHKLRCIAAYYRTPFTPEVIHQNVLRLVKKLNVPLIPIDISAKKHLSLAKKAVNLWLKTKDTNIANLACGVCKLVNREVYIIAKKEKVSSIIYGSSSLEAFQFNAAKHTEAANNSLNDGIIKAYNIITSGISSLFQSPQLLYFIPIGIKSSLLYISPHTPWLKFRHPKTTAYDYFSYRSWDEKEADLALNEIGWVLPSDFDIKWRADCYFNELKNVMFSKSIGCTYVDAYFSNMIRAQIITKDEALKRINENEKNAYKRVEHVCEKLNINPSLFK